MPWWVTVRLGEVSHITKSIRIHSKCNWGSLIKYTPYKNPYVCSSWLHPEMRVSIKRLLFICTFGIICWFFEFTEIICKIKFVTFPFSFRLFSCTHLKLTNIFQFRQIIIYCSAVANIQSVLSLFVHGFQSLALTLLEWRSFFLTKCFAMVNSLWLQPWWICHITV